MRLLVLCVSSDVACNSSPSHSPARRMRPTDRLAGHRALGLLCGRGRWHRPPSTMNSEFISSPDCQLLPARRDRQRSLYFMSTRARTLAHAHEHGRRPSWPRTSDSRSQVRPRFSPLERPSHLPWPETSSDPSVEHEPRARPANGNPAHPHCRSSSITRRGHPCAPSGCTSPLSSAYLKRGSIHRLHFVVVYHAFI